MSYFQGDIAQPDTYKALAAHIDGFDKRLKLAGNVLFYLALPEKFFGPTVQHLGNAGLLQQSEQFWRRVVIEKPFGHDVESAKTLNDDILKCLDESQIYRIDHFLGKETVQNIMALRFANGIFEPLWRRDHIDYVEITAAETIGVELRGAFYEPTGALRDMVPNHCFQLLSMIGMEPPNSFDAEAVRNEKAKLLAAIHPVRVEDVVRGQYAAGTVMGKAVAAYRDEPDVAHDSRTETYVALKFGIDNWRWSGVPFYLRTGKRMGGRQTQVVVHFRKPPYALFRDTEVGALEENVLTLEMQPNEGLTLSISAKHPGPKMVLAPVAMSFAYKDAFKLEPNVGYETLIYDCLIGDPTLFQRADMIEASWAAVDPAIQHAGDEPELYAAGSAGPESADALLARAGHAWAGMEA